MSFWRPITKESLPSVHVLPERYRETWREGCMKKEKKLRFIMNRFLGKATFSWNCRIMGSRNSAPLTSSWCVCRRRLESTLWRQMTCIILTQKMKSHMISCFAFRQGKSSQTRIGCAMKADSTTWSPKKRWQHFSHMHRRRWKIHRRLQTDAM